MILCENDNTSKLYLFSFSIAEHFLPTWQHYSTTWLCDCQGYTRRYTGTLQAAHIRFAAPNHLYPRLHLVCSYFIYFDNWLSIYNRAYFLSHYKCYWGNDKLFISNIWTKLCTVTRELEGLIHLYFFISHICLYVSTAREHVSLISTTYSRLNGMSLKIIH